ncbi:MAG: hypothetical protein QF689_05235, partial [Candidatus Latescibacteria bacterium]|nr:hypothetical protein [Candidatus Latescibacterota bacterium]
TLQVPSPFGQGLEGVLDGVGDTFTHWRHMTNLSRSNNAWRVCYDISDVGTIVTDLEAPIEQWPAFRPQRRDAWR